MKISIVTDEVSSDLETALELISGWGVRDVELRGIGVGRVPLLSAFEREQLEDTLDRYQCRVVAISPGLFKIPYTGADRSGFPVKAIDAGIFENWTRARDLLRFHREELLPASIEFCKSIGAAVLVAFGFERGTLPPGPAPDGVLEALRLAAEQCARSGIALAIEVDAGFWADTGVRSAALVRAVNHPSLGLNWDPGNAFEEGETPYPDGYAAVRPFVRHVHFKDAVRRGSGIDYAVFGEIDWKGQIEALAQDGYSGYVSVETHMRPKVASAQAVYERLRDLVVTTEGKANESRVTG